MASLFSRRANALIRATLLAVVVLVVGVPLFLMGWVRTSYARGVGREIAQPIPFDHRVHVTGLRIDCRYCHSDVEHAPTAGLPSTKTCLPCHTQLWRSSSVFAPVRKSLASGRPIPWKRVTQLPDFVFFDHSIHVQKGVGCESCHGRVDRMATVVQVAPLTMGWCLECHRDPAPHLRPVEAMTAMGWEPEKPQPALGKTLAARYGVKSLTYCTACHR